MTSNLDSRYSCLPITALEIIQGKGAVLLLSGQGPNLRVAPVDGSATRCAQWRVFESEVVHGIASKYNGIPEDEGDDFTLLIYGGVSTCLAKLKIVDNSSSDLYNFIHLIVGPELNLGDWVLHGQLAPKDGDCDSEAFVLTAHNILFGLSLSSDSLAKKLDLSLNHVSSGPESSLYSAHLTFSSSGVIIVAAGTVFGEILVWSFQLTSKAGYMPGILHYTYLGHKGSVFGVCISHEVEHNGSVRRFLASCSDDRTIRIWDIGDFTSVNRNSLSQAHISQLNSNTGFRDNAPVAGNSPLAVTWGHLSRIWGVEFFPCFDIDGQTQTLLMSRGEDATCQIWRLISEKSQSNRDSQNAHSLEHLHTDRHHFGKNIWSTTSAKFESSLAVYTGGADGRIMSRAYDSSSYNAIASMGLRSSTPFGTFSLEIQGANNSSTTTVGKAASTAAAIKQYLFVYPHYLLAATGDGRLLQAKVDSENTILSWNLLCGGKKEFPRLLSSNCANGVAFVTGADSGVFAVRPTDPLIRKVPIEVRSQVSWMCIAWSLHSQSGGGDEICLAISTRSNSAMNLLWIKMKTEKFSARETVVEMPATFVPTAACYYPPGRVLLLGSRAGAIAIYHNIDESCKHSEAAQIIRHVHGGDTVSSIVVLGPSQKRDTNFHEPAAAIYMLTTGRDGTYAVHKVSRYSDAGSRSGSIFETVHSSSPPFGPNIEGAFLTVSENAEESSNLLLYGFRSKDFVVWNESRQAEVFSVECGGPHRSWSYISNSEASAEAKRSGAGSFIWTKAGCVNVFRQTSSNHVCISDGGHGREIKTLAKHPKPYLDPGRHVKNATLVATGAEDTTIRLFAINDGESLATGGSIECNMLCIGTLKKHTTGLQHLAFSRCGNFLFSSAGCEEMFAWRLWTNVPYIGIGVVLEATLPKEETDSDARITYFDVRDDKSDMNLDRKTLLITAAYSSGKVKLVAYTAGQASSEGRFDMLQEFVQGAFCLTYLSLVDVSFQNATILTAGTNGCASVANIALTRAVKTKPRSLSVGIHQNSVKAGKVLNLTADLKLLISGGDDNALGFTMIGPWRDVPVSAPGNTFQTLLIPSAHSAAVTALSAITVRSTSAIIQAIVFSTGNDQRIKTWRLTINLNVKVAALDNIQVEKLGETWTAVADIGAMELTDSRRCEIIDIDSDGKDWETRLRVLVVGVGMEIFDIRIPCSEGMLVENN